MAKTEDEKMYSLICKERFDDIADKQDEMLGLLRGANSTPGLVEEVRVLKSRWKMVSVGIVLVLSAFVTQIVRWIFTKP